MHLQFLLEDMSGEVLIHKVMTKLMSEVHSFTYDCKSFKGIGGFKSHGSVNDIKTNKLLSDLLIYLKGFDKCFMNYDACIFVVVDNDTRDTALFKEELEMKARQAMISTDCVFCIAVEEMEAWLLGDEQAILKAYPNARMSRYREYVQDSICGTWEVLADIVYRGGLVKLKKECPTYREIGACKSEWANNIGHFMELNENKSPSFRFFLREIRKRIT